MLAACSQHTDDFFLCILTDSYFVWGRYMVDGYFPKD